MGYIAVDLDGTLAYHVPGRHFDGISIGKPIPAMVDRVKAWIAAGKEVRIMTARVSPLSLSTNDKSLTDVREAIRNWCEDYIGKKLDVTCEKDYRMEVLYDDRAVQVERNTGRLTVDAVRAQAQEASSLSASWDLPPIGGFHGDD